jgi:hypothetical protein
MPVMAWSQWLDGALTASVRILCSAAVVGFIPACSSHAATADIPSFKDVSDAPVKIQEAAAAVVRIGTAGQSATGSFISPNGILITNNHVLGIDVCPIEGCYAALTFMYQRHATPQAPQTVFVVPLAIDVGLDMAVMQVHSAGPAGPPLSTPHYLTLDSRDPASLLGSHVNVVGHPEGHLKKWTEGRVVDSNGAWISFSAYSLPGSSGSPVLDDDGNMVGILHRGPTTQDLLSDVGVDEYSIGTASSALIAAMSAPLPADLWSVAAPATDDEVVQHQVVYLNARAMTATVDSATKPVLSSLGAACDAGLAVQDYDSPEDFDAGLSSCLAGELWIECRSDVLSGGGAFGVCPADASAWTQRYNTVFDRTRALNGELDFDAVSYAVARLADSTTDGVTAGAHSLEMALATASPPLDFNVAEYLAAFGIDTYAGMTLANFTQDYATFADFPLSAIQIASTAVSLAGTQAIDNSTALSILQALASDPTVDVGAKLYIEDVRYQSGALD